MSRKGYVHFKSLFVCFSSPPWSIGFGFVLALVVATVYFVFALELSAFVSEEFHSKAVYVLLKKKKVASVKIRSRNTKGKGGGGGVDSE